MKSRAAFEQQEFVFGRSGKSQQRLCAQAFEINFGNDLGEEAEQDPRLDPLFFADEKSISELFQVLLGHYKNHLINDLTAQQIREFREGKRGI